MAEILFGLATGILKNVGSLAAEEVTSIYGLADELDKLSDTVSSIQAILIDTEEALPEPYSVQLNLDRETYSFVPDGEVIGRSDDKKKIMDFLLDSKVEENVVVISIVGLGGLGKTTLAQCVFSDEMIKKNFDKALWVYVLDVFEVKMIAEKISESGEGKKDNYPQLDAVQNELRKMLDGKKYLLVLDDVWNADPLKWLRLKNMLISEAKGSKILLTTRSNVVAKVSGSVHKHKLGDLSEEEAWRLFEKMAFGCNKESKNSNLVEIGKEIVRKCGGVPLAIRKHMKLRTFSYLNSYSMSVMSNSTLERMISSFSCLRVLHLGHLGIEFLPQSLGGLKHLRYLSISSLSIVTLPNTVTKLHNLQILKLDDCRRLHNLPRDNWRLVSLRHLVCQGCWSLTHIPPGLSQLTSLVHLDFDGCSSLEDMPAEIGQVTSLWTLPSFIIGKESCISGQVSDKLNELQRLVDLRNSLSIKFMGRVGAIGERTPTGVVKRMKHLRQLNVDFEYGYHRDVDTGAHLMMLEALQPHQNIEGLRIKDYNGLRFPSWLMVENLGLLLPKLVDLHIEDCHKCQKLPPLWKLPSLQSLELRNLGGLEGISEKISKQILCPSPHHPSPLCNLKELTVDSVEGLATMSEDVFKNLMSLQSLSIKNCKNLISLSTCLTHLTSLETLTIAYCPELDLSSEEEMQFQVPGNLSTLNLWELDKLMSLPLWLRHFSATLKSLYISGCPNFTTIPEWIGDLVALNLLEIYECPMLTSLTEAMRSLTALQRLNILWCSSILK
ncbi:hypothetical protein CQW23_22713 [Capsicum baccatum]|uniref:Uncharacterized protein n=1 Tax=Capsicum baccatum TaxID=33114 RepID=A0A2G2W1N2_CAPBA|nr:hypothetical protein CQW23_22713 [Capsicum baccatum]